MASKETPRKRAPRGQGAALRGEVLAAAMDLLRETGSEEAMSLRTVAQRVGVSVPSIYLHFADKQTLIDAICEEVFEQLHVVLKTASSDAPDPWQGLRAQGNAYVHFALDNPEHYRLVMMRPPPHGAAREDKMVAIASGAFGHLVATITSCIHLGIFEGDPLTLSIRLWAGVHGIASLLIAKPSFQTDDVNQLIDDVICMSGTGLAASSRLPEDLTSAALTERLNRLR